MEKERKISPFVEKVLSGFYHIESIQAVDFREKNDREYEIEFSFLPYKKVVHPLSHVSANQIHEAIMEGMYLVVAKEIEKGKITGCIFKDFLELRGVALFREIHIKFKKEIRVYPEKHILRFVVSNSKNIRDRYSSFEVTFQGFCAGKAKALIPAEAFVGNILNS